MSNNIVEAFKRHNEPATPSVHAIRRMEELKQKYGINEGRLLLEAEPVVPVKSPQKKD